MAKAPYEGAGDPKKDPWTTDLMREYRRDFHKTLLDFLRTQPAARQVAAAYLWDEDSWDPFGLDKEAFKDEEIIRMIGEHNAKIER